MRVGSSSSKRRGVRESLLRPRLPVVHRGLTVLRPPALALGISVPGRLRLSLLDRDDTETVSRRLRPVALLAILLVGAGLLRASDSDDRALHECGVLGVATEQGHVVERHPTVLPLLRLPVLLPEVLGDRERCAGLPVVAVLDLRVSGETALKSDLCHVSVVLILCGGGGCCGLDGGEFVGGGPFVSSLEPVRAGVALGS